MSCSAVFAEGQGARSLAAREAEDIETLLVGVRLNRRCLGALISVSFELTEAGEAEAAPEWEGALDRCFASCWSSQGNPWEAVAAVRRLKADPAAWTRLLEQIWGVVGSASKWPEMARLLAAPVGNA